MNAHSTKMRTAPGFLLVVVAVFCLTAGISTVALAQGRVAPVPPPPQAAAPAPVEPGASPPAPPPQISRTPAPAEPAAALPALIAPVIPEPAAPTLEALGLTCPPEYVPLVQKTTVALMSENFTFYPIKALDPFVPFISPDTTGSQVHVPGEGEEDEPRADFERPLTPLQKMTVVEIERGSRRFHGEISAERPLSRIPPAKDTSFRSGPRPESAMG